MNEDRSLEEIYQELIEKSPQMAQYFRLTDMEFTSRLSDNTGGKLQDLWLKNAKTNLKKFPNFRLVKDVCRGFGSNKAAILIGAGPSYNKNKDLLKQICLANSQYEFEYQPFLIVCSNHQFKPCLEEGIIPHFVILMDASDVVYDQLCVDIPRYAKGVNLLANFRSDTRVLKTWQEQKRNLLFFMLQSKWAEEDLKEVHSDEYLYHQAIPPAGNVINQAWLITFAYMGATVFMALGNDLSYDYDNDLEKRREKYYADKDYSANIGTGRDEANKVIPWMGFEWREYAVMPGEIYLKHIPKATTVQLLLYKIWLEARIGLQASHAIPFHYYNCSEGILGMLSRKEGMFLDKESFDDENNWHLLDEVYPRHYHTRTFEQATNEFLTARSILCQQEIRTVVGSATG